MVRQLSLKNHTIESKKADAGKALGSVFSVIVVPHGGGRRKN